MFGTKKFMKYGYAINIKYFSEKCKTFRCEFDLEKSTWTASLGGGSKKSKVDTFLMPIDNIWNDGAKNMF